jgi:hypothetical protein
MVRLRPLILLLAATLLLTGPAGIGLAAAYAQACLSVSDTRAAVSNRQAKPFSAFSRTLEQQGSKVVSYCLAPRGKGFVYQGKILKSNGQLVPFSVSAN